MRYVSTRAASLPLSFSQALMQSLAPDGGLYVPETFPPLDRALLAAASAAGPSALPLDDIQLATFAPAMLAPFLHGDPLAAALAEITARALGFPVPLVPLDDGAMLLELFHGPTCAFKDVGARFLAECTARLRQMEQAGDSRAQTLLVATSGDTGGAVAAAFCGRPGIDVVILFPKGKVSARQEHQLTCWGQNVRAVRVRGDFDDCQRIVKAAFASPAWVAAHRPLSANSINIGRLLPQAAYYAAASLRYQASTGVAPGVIVPSGNLGNATAALWAMRCGAPIREVVMATNANRAVPDYVASGRWQPQPTVATLANAMDVGNPSNMERTRHLYADDIQALRREVDALSVSDDAIRRTIAAGPRRYGHIFCPHTATAVHAREVLGGRDWIVVATAHPAKFETIVEPLIGAQVALPPALAALLDRPTAALEIDPSLDALTKCLG